MSRSRRGPSRKKHGPQESLRADAEIVSGPEPSSGPPSEPPSASPNALAADDLEPKARPSFRGGLAEAIRSIQAEDVALFLWVVFVERLLERYFGAELRTVAVLGAAPRWVYVLVFGGLAIVFYTRGPADRDANEATSRRCVLGLLGWVVARSYFAGDKDWFIRAFAVAFLVVILIAPLNHLERLYRTGLGLRRTLVLPAQLVGNSIFSGIITPEFFRGSELHAVAPEYRFFASLVLSAFLFLYVVVAPRVMAGEAWRPLSWVVRLGVYLSALLIGRPSWLDFEVEP